MGTNPTNIIRCDKCDFSTVLPRKFREHLVQAHDLQISPSHYGLPYTSPIFRQGYGSLQDRTNPLDLTHTHSTPMSNSRSATNALTSFLRGMHNTPPVYGGTNQSFTQGQGMNQMTGFHNPHNSNDHEQAQNNLASSYLRSIVSSIVNNPVPNFPPANSTVSSSNLFTSVAAETHPSVNLQVNQGQVKVKQEPPDSPQATDLSKRSSFQAFQYDTCPDRPTRMSLNNDILYNNQARRSSTPLDFSSRTVSTSFDGNRSFMNSFGASPSRQRDRFGVHQSLDSYESFSIGRARLRNNHNGNHGNQNSTSGLDSFRSRDYHNNSFSQLYTPRSRSRSLGDRAQDLTSSFIQGANNSSVTTDCTRSIVVKKETTNGNQCMSDVGVQCRMPSVKSESSNHDNQQSNDGQRTMGDFVDQGVQCELMSTVQLLNQRNLNNDNESDYSSESQQNFQLPCHRCNHCSITFDDEVLFSIHIGCHSHTDPFVCNVCGKHCGNKYGFYSHIMRGHHY